jgi:hypothetical protein
VDNQTYAIIGQVVGIIASLIILFKKGSSDTKKLSKIVTDNLTGNNVKLTSLSLDFTEFKAIILFKRKLKNKIRSKATNLVDSEVTLQDKYHTMLTILARYFEEYALGFYENEYRSVDYEIRPYLNRDMDGIISKFENIMDHINPNPRMFHYSTGKQEWISYKAFIRKLNLYSLPFSDTRNSLTDKLIERLIENGINHDELIDIFINYLTEFFKTIIVKSKYFEDKLTDE